MKPFASSADSFWRQSLRFEGVCLLFMAAVYLFADLVYRSAYFNSHLLILYGLFLLTLFFLLPSGWLHTVVKPVWEAWWGLDRGETRRLLRTVIVSTLVFTLIAHGFLFTNEFVSHDSSFVLTYGDCGFYISVGRMLIPYCEALKGSVPLPWLICLLFLIYITLANLFLVHLLELRSKAGIAVACGLTCTNTALTLTGATYIYCFDEYALALLLAVLGAWLFCRRKGGGLLGVVCIAASLALYQPYFTLAAGLCFFAVIQRLLKHEPAAKAIWTGIRLLALLAAGFLLYYLWWNLQCRMLGIDMVRTSESLLSAGLSALPSLLYQAYVSYLAFLRQPPALFGHLLMTVHILLLFLLAVKVFSCLANRTLRRGSKLLLVLLCLLTPLACNSAYLLLVGNNHDLTTYAQGLIYLLPLYFWDTPVVSLKHFYGNNQRYQIAVVALLGIVLWNNVTFSNQAYIKKEMDKSATLTLMSRVLDRIESTEGYVPGETEIAVIGSLHENTLLNHGRSGFSVVQGKSGMGSDYSVSYTFESYVLRYLNYPARFTDSASFAELEEVQNMPALPDTGAIRMIDGVVVVKLS